MEENKAEVNLALFCGPVALGGGGVKTGLIFDETDG